MHVCIWCKTNTVLFGPGPHNCLSDYWAIFLRLPLWIQTRKARRLAGCNEPFKKKKSLPSRINDFELGGDVRCPSHLALLHFPQAKQKTPPKASLTKPTSSSCPRTGLWRITRTGAASIQKPGRPFQKAEITPLDSGQDTRSRITSCPHTLPDCPTSLGNFRVVPFPYYTRKRV